MNTKSLSTIALEEASDELTDYEVYRRLAKLTRKRQEKEIFEKLAATEQKHYRFWIKYNKNIRVEPHNLKIRFVMLLRRIMGSSFIIKFVEGSEQAAVKKYEAIRDKIPNEDLPNFDRMISEEESHERTFADQIEGGYVRYISFIVLGLADALVEIAGIHAGSLGIYNSTQLTGLAGIVAGAAASISMASAAYAQAKQGFKGSAKIAAAYTGIAYFISALLLATPYFFTSVMTHALLMSLIVGFIIIAAASWYNSVMSGSKFVNDFIELAGIMICATIVLFLFGTFMRDLFNISI